MPTLTPEQLSLRRIAGRIGGLRTASTHDSKVLTAPARRAFEQRFIIEVDPLGELPEAERNRRAAAARKAYFTKLAYKSARARAKS